MPNLDAEALCEALIAQIRPHVTATTALVGIHTGGVWLAERLHGALGITPPLGSIDISFYRDDLNAKGLRGGMKRSDIPFPVEGAHIIIVDDVLFTGRTTRAAMNELFDFGRPARVDLAVLVDRGSRELPVSPTYCAHVLTPPLPRTQTLELECSTEGPDAGQFHLRLIDA